MISGNFAMHGEVITWDVNSVETTIDDVRRALEVAGLDPGAAGDLSVKSAFGRAKKEFAGSSRECAVDQLEGQGLAYQLTQKSEHNGKIDYVYDQTVELTEDGRVQADDPAFAEQVQEAVQEALVKRTNSDITRLVQKLFKEHADLFPLNRKGVAYFVPERYREFTERVESFIKQVGGTIHRLPVPEGTAHGDESVSDAMARGFEKAAQDIEAMVDEWDDDTKSGTIERAQERLDKLLVKSTGYESIMASHRNRLRSVIEEVEGKIQQRASALIKEVSSS